MGDQISIEAEHKPAQAGVIMVALAPHLMVPVLHLLLFTPPPFRLRRAIMVAGTAALAYPCLFDQTRNAAIDAGASSSSTSQMRYGLSAIWMSYLGSVAKMAFHDPEREFWRS